MEGSGHFLVSMAKAYGARVIQIALEDDRLVKDIRRIALSSTPDFAIQEITVSIGDEGTDPYIRLTEPMGLNLPLRLFFQNLFNFIKTDPICRSIVSELRKTNTRGFTIGGYLLSCGIVRNPASNKSEPAIPSPSTTEAFRQTMKQMGCDDSDSPDSK
jgi:hypothetical protein